MLQCCHFSINLRYERYLPPNRRSSKCTSLAKYTTTIYKCSHGVISRSTCDMKDICQQRQRSSCLQKTRSHLSQQRFEEDSCRKRTDLAKTQTITVYKCFNAATSRSTSDMKDICQQAERSSSLLKTRIHLSQQRFDEDSCRKRTDLAKTQTITVYKCFNAATSRSTCDMKDIMPANRKKQLLAKTVRYSSFVVNHEHSCRIC